MKKLIMLSLFTYTLSFTNAAAQGTWSPRDTLPYDTNAMAQGISGFTIGNYGYAGLGSYNYGVGVFDELWRFDPSTNSWTQKSPFPGRARVAPASFVIGNKAYLVTGSVDNGGACVTECWEYDATTNIWTQKTNFPSSARTYAVGFAIGGKGYVGTGANEYTDFTNDFYTYDTTGIGSWTRIADFPGIARDAASGFSVNGNGYVCFGKDSTYKLYSDIWEYDPGNNTWTQKTDNPQYMGLTSGFVICNNIYVGSGDTNAVIDRYREFWKYNTVSDSWTQVASVPGVKQCEGVAFSIGDTGYYGFGFDTFALVHNVFEQFYDNDSCNIITGNNTNTDVSEIRIYPNPTNQKLNLEFNNQDAGLVTLSIMDITGREAMNSQFTIYNTPFTLDVSSLASGMYFIQIKNNKINVIQKFIKQ